MKNSIFAICLLSYLNCFNQNSEVIGQKNKLTFAFGGNYSQLENHSNRTLTGGKQTTPLKFDGNGFSYGLTYERLLTKNWGAYTEMHGATALLEPAKNSIVTNEAFNFHFDFMQGFIKSFYITENSKFWVQAGVEINIYENSSENQNSNVAFYDYGGLNLTGKLIYNLTEKSKFELHLSTPIFGYIDNIENLSFAPQIPPSELHAFDEAEENSWVSIDKHLGLRSRFRYSCKLSSKFSLLAEYQWRFFQVNLNERITFQSNQLRIGTALNF